MKAIISDCSKFQIVQEEKHLNFILNQEKNFEKLLNPCMKKVLLEANI